MNYKSAILFIFLMIFSVNMYFIISEYHDKYVASNNPYDLYPVTQPQNITPYKPITNRGSFEKQFNDFSNSEYSYQQPSIIYPYHISEPTEKNNFGYINNILRSGYTTQETKQIKSTGRWLTEDGLTFFSRGKSSGRESNPTAYNSQIIANIENVGLFQSSPSGFQNQFNLNENTGIRYPDPGGDNDIVFIPVPDGLWILIFFLTLYA